MTFQVEIIPIAFKDDRACRILRPARRAIELLIEIAFLVSSPIVL